MVLFMDYNLGIFIDIIFKSIKFINIRLPVFAPGFVWNGYKAVHWSRQTKFENLDLQTFSLDLTIAGIITENFNNNSTYQNHCKSIIKKTNIYLVGSQKICLIHFAKKITLK